MAKWNRYSRCNRETSPWNHFHGAVVSLSSLQPTNPLHGITSTVPWYRYPHCGRPNRSVESLSRRHGFTILTATDQTPLWNHFQGAMVSLSTLQPTKLLQGITSTASWFYYPHCDRPNSVDSLPRRHRLMNLTAAAKLSPLESLSRRHGSTAQDVPP